MPSCPRFVPGIFLRIFPDWEVLAGLFQREEALCWHIPTPFHGIPCLIKPFVLVHVSSSLRRHTKIAIFNKFPQPGTKNCVLAVAESLAILDLDCASLIFLLGCS